MSQRTPGKSPVNRISDKTKKRRHNPQIQNYALTTPIHNTNKAENIKFIKEFMLRLHNIGSPTGLRRNAEKRNSPTKQCSKAIPPVVYLPSEVHNGSPILDGELRNTHCWLCGHPLVRMRSATHCEHLLPVIYATLYSGIINRELNNPSNETPNNVDMEKLTKMAQTNYAWAHGWCNIIKSDIMLIQPDPKTGYSTVDASTCDILAERIIQKVKIKRIAEVKDTYSNVLKDEDYKPKMLEHYNKVLTKMINPINAELDVYIDEYKKHFSNHNTELDMSTYISNARREYLTSCLYLSHLYFYKNGQIELNYPQFKDAYNTYIHSIEWKFPPNAPIKQLPTSNEDNYFLENSVSYPEFRKLTLMNEENDINIPQVTNDINIPSPQNITKKRKANNDNNMINTPAKSRIPSHINNNYIKNKRRSSNKSQSNNRTPTDNISPNTKNRRILALYE